MDHAFSRIDCREDGHRYVVLYIDELSCSPMGVETNLLEHEGSSMECNLDICPEVCPNGERAGQGYIL